MENRDEMVDFVVTARKYKTLLTNKYKARQPWKRPVEGEVLSTLPGTIISLAVKEGDKVEEGQLLLMHEAMKMYNRIVSPVSGTVKKINVKAGDKIGKNFLMVEIK